MIIDWKVQIIGKHCYSIAYIWFKPFLLIDNFINYLTAYWKHNRLFSALIENFRKTHFQDFVYIKCIFQFFSVNKRRIDKLDKKQLGTLEHCFRFNKTLVTTFISHTFKSCCQCAEGLWWWEPLTVQAEKHGVTQFHWSVVSLKAIHHYHHHNHHQHHQILVFPM